MKNKDHKEKGKNYKIKPNQFRMWMPKHYYSNDSERFFHVISSYTKKGNIQMLLLRYIDGSTEEINIEKVEKYSALTSKYG